MTTAAGSGDRTYASPFEASFDAVLVLGLDGTILDANPATCRLLGWTRDEMRRRSWHHLFDTGGKPVEHYLRELQVTGSPVSERRVMCSDGTLRPVQVSRALDSGDFHGARCATIVLRDMSALAASREMIRYRDQELAAQRNTTPNLARRTDAGSLLQAIVSRAADLMRTPHGFLCVVERSAGGQEDLLVIRAGTGMFSDSLDSQLRRGEGLAGKVWEKGLPLAVDDYNSWEGRRSGFLELCAVAGVPLWAGAEVIGVMGMAYRGEDCTFDGEKMTLLENFGQFASLALENAALYEAVQQELTERKRAEDALRSSERRYRLLFERNLAGVFRTTPDGRILDCNDALAHILGCDSRDELLGRPASDFYFDSEERARVVSDLELQQAVPGSEILLKRKDGTQVWVLESASLVEADPGDGAPVVIEGTIIDITARKRLEEQLVHQAFHDPLTGLPNRSLFMDRLGHAMSRASRSAGSLAVLFLDLDEFKAINDTMGHKMGDHLLVAVGHRLEGAVRPGDTVARLGGDEFTVLLEDIRGLPEAVRVAGRIAEQLHDPFYLEGHVLFVTTSVGIALDDHGKSQPADLLRNADLAMYEAKRKGKARYSIFGETGVRRDS